MEQPDGDDEGPCGGHRALWWEMQAGENEQRDTVKGVSRTQLSCAIVLTSLTSPAFLVDLMVPSPT